MALLPTLENYWELDEASGNRSDDVGGITLTDHNTVGSTSGLGTTVATFIKANNEWLDSSTLAYVGNPGTVSFWFNVDSGIVQDSYYGIFVLDDADTVHFRFRALGTPTTNQYILYSTITDNTDSEFGNSYATELATGVWHHVLVTWTTTTVTYYFDGSNSGWTQNTQTISGGINQDTPSNPLTKIGTQYDVEGTGNQFLGKIAKAGLWSSVLGGADIATLYGSGTPPSYPFGEGGGRNPVPMGFVLE